MKLGKIIYGFWKKSRRIQGLKIGIGSAGNRNKAFGRAREFGRKMYDLLELMVYDEEVKKHV